MNAFLHGERLTARPTRPDDLDFVLAAEGDAENAPFVLQWSRDRHARALADPDLLHWTLELRARAARVGYVILAGLAQPHHNVEFRRIVVTEKGRGYGREALGLVQRAAFEEHHAHRLWLDVMEHNVRAQRLYRSAGFRVEGVLHDRYRLDGRWVTLVVMAMLSEEYERR